MNSGHPVVRIAHAYGNTRERLATALAADVDVIELDLWFRGGELYVHHERRNRWLPLLYDKRMSGHARGQYAVPFGRYYVRPDINRLTLGEVMERTAGKKALLIDVKGDYLGPLGEAFVAKLAGTIREHKAEAWSKVCGQTGPLDRLREVAPDLEVRYSIDKQFQWERWLPKVEANPPSRTLCMSYKFLDGEKARFLEEHGVDLYCWTIDDPSIAAELVRRGVDGITSNNLPLLAELPRSPAEA